MSDYEIDVCLSFAGEERPYVEQVAGILRDRGVKLFYDGYEEAELWGTDLYVHLDSVYRKESRYCVIFASSAYAGKIWTNHERESAQARALQENEAYILPARFDDTEIPGIRPTIGYVDLRAKTPSQLADLIVRKLASVERRNISGGSSGPAYSTVPVTEEERASLVALRPSAWEYYLFAGIMLEGKDSLQSKRRDYEMGYAMPVRRISDDEEAATYMQDRLSDAERLNGNVMAVFGESVQLLAFGRQGESGDIGYITHLARRLIDSYEAYLDWAADIRGTTAGLHLVRLFDLTARMVGGSIRRVEEFIDAYAAEVRGLPERIARGGAIEIQLKLILEVDREVSDALSQELALLTKARNDQRLTE